MMGALRIGIDIGGTFTDFVVFDPQAGKLVTFKLLSTPQNPAGAVLQGLQTVYESLHTAQSDPSHAPSSTPCALTIIHGSTVATNALLERKADARFVTLLVIHWQPRSGRMRMANAGAMPPLVCRGGQILKPRVEGVPLGLLDDREYEDLVFQTQPGDLVVLYSDGITDQLSPSGEDYGRRRLVNLLKQSCHGSPQSVIDAIYADLDAFAPGVASFDDQTVVVLRVK